MVEEIYKNYRMYELTAGEDLLQFQNSDLMTRSQKGLELLSQNLPSEGRLLDIGTGSGVMLKSAAKILPTWKFSAQDVVRKEESNLRNIDGFESFETSLDGFPTQHFDVVVLWHCLEHVIDLGEILRRIKRLLKPDGKLFIQVPDVARQDLDLFTFDHASHFDRDSLMELMQRHGWSCVIDVCSSFPNCLTASFKLDLQPSLLKFNSVKEPLAKGKQWLNRLNNRCARLEKEMTSSSLQVIIFGTTPASLAIYLIAPDRVHAFMDEDPRRVGKKWQDKEVIAPKELVGPALIVFALEETRASQISTRLREENCWSKSVEFCF